MLLVFFWSGEIAVWVIEGQVTKTSEGAWVGTRAATTQLPPDCGPGTSFPRSLKSRALVGQFT